jgi:hypothetical protein
LQDRTPQWIYRRRAADRQLRSERSAEVASSVCQRRDCGNSCRDELTFPELFEIEEEETFALAVAKVCLA